MRKVRPCRITVQRLKSPNTNYLRFPFWSLGHGQYTPTVVRQFLIFVHDGTSVQNRGTRQAMFR